MSEIRRQCHYLNKQRCDLKILSLKEELVAINQPPEYKMSCALRRSTIDPIIYIVQVYITDCTVRRPYRGRTHKQTVSSLSFRLTVAHNTEKCSLMFHGRYSIRWLNSITFCLLQIQRYRGRAEKTREAFDHH